MNWIQARPWASEGQSWLPATSTVAPQPEAQHGMACPCPACPQPRGGLTPRLQDLPPSLCPPSELLEPHVSGCPASTQLRGTWGWHGLSTVTAPVPERVKSDTWGRSDPPPASAWLPVVKNFGACGSCSKSEKQKIGQLQPVRPADRLWLCAALAPRVQGNQQPDGAGRHPRCSGWLLF